MSTPARKIPDGPPRKPRPARKGAPARKARTDSPPQGRAADRNATKPSPGKVASQPRLRVIDARSKRRGGHVGFGVLASTLIGLMILGVVALNALLAQASFRIDDLSTRIDGLSQQYLQLTREQATLSAPGRIAAWAHRHGMRLPDDIHILHVPGTGRAAPAGVPDTSGPGPDSASGLGPEELALKAVVEGQT